MLLILGAFDNSGCPIFKIRVAGSNPSREYVAVIDTAFNGFVAMPINEMIELGLKPEGATTVILGDGSATDNLVAPGSVTIGPQTEMGDILLDERSNQVLVGMG